MLEVLGITAPIFILIGVGYLAARLRLLTPEQIRGVGTFVITFALPALVIRALSERPIAETFDGRYLFVYAIASLGSFATGLFVFLRLRHKGLENAAIAGMGMSVSNSGFIGFPIAVMVVGAGSAIQLALGMLVENLLMIPICLALAEAGRSGGGSTWQTLRGVFSRLLKNPLILGMLAGASLSLLGWRLPGPALKAVDMLAQASAPAALFVIGGVLCGTKVTGQLGEIGIISAGKLVLHPLLLALLFWGLGDFPRETVLAGLVLASAPMMSIYPILGQRHGLEGRCAAALVLTTLASFFSISVLLMLVSG